MLEEKILTVDNLKTYYFSWKGLVKAVDGVNLGIKKGEAVGLVGESGCGKSTVARSIMRLVPSPGRIVSGRIIYKGNDLCEFTEKEMRRLYGREISIVFQDPMTYLNPVMSIGSQIKEVFSQEKTKKNADEIKAKTIAALESVRLPHALNLMKSYPHEISGGMRQRVLIAMATLANPSLLILDEPGSALDVTVQAQILKLIKELQNRMKTALLMITHDLGVVAEICDRICVMYASQIVESADVFRLYENPKHPYTQGLLESILSIDEFKKELKTIEGVVPSLVNPPKGCRFHPRCPHVKEICRKQEPPNIEVEDEHTTSCWLYR